MLQVFVVQGDRVVVHGVPGRVLSRRPPRCLRGAGR
jgi:hypothetical protein